MGKKKEMTEREIRLRKKALVSKYEALKRKHVDRTSDAMRLNASVAQLESMAKHGGFDDELVALIRLVKAKMAPIRSAADQAEEAARVAVTIFIEEVMDPTKVETLAPEGLRDCADNHF